jgi:hypothetical protein
MVTLFARETGREAVEEALRAGAVQVKRPRGPELEVAGGRAHRRCVRAQPRRKRQTGGPGEAAAPGLALHPRFRRMRA